MEPEGASGKRLDYGRVEIELGGMRSGFQSSVVEPDAGPKRNLLSGT
jgi:hypothetical protein